MACRDGAMRLELLQLIDSRLECEDFRDDVAEAILTGALQPCLIWQAGKIAAATRFAAITAVATIFRAKLFPSSTASRLMHQVCSRLIAALCIFAVLEIAKTTLVGSR